jgi:hypothetical protein
MGHVVFRETLFDSMVHSMGTQGQILVGDLAAQDIKIDLIAPFLSVHPWQAPFWYNA